MENNDQKNNNDLKCPLCKEKFDMNDISDDNCFKICQKIENVNYNINKKMKFNLILRDKKSQTLYNLINDPLLDNWENNFRSKMRDIPEKNIKEFNFSRIFLANEKLMKIILNAYKSDLNDLKKEFDPTSDELKKLSINQCINKIDSLISKCKYENLSKEKNESDKKKLVQTNNNIKSLIIYY